MNEEALEVRLSHILRDCSVGAIVQGEKLMVAVQDISRWYASGPPPDREIRYVAQVRAALGIEQRLCEPPTGSVNEQGAVEGASIPATRFPEWMRCPARHCGLLHNRPWRDRKAGTRLTCQSDGCKRALEQVPWVVAHEDGYLADVPWHDIAHRSGGDGSDSGSCQRDWSEPYLRLVEGEGTHRVRCMRCNASDKLPRVLNFPQHARMQPWANAPPPTVPESQAWLLEVNDVRVHASWTNSALVIPPESRIRKGTVVDRLYGNSHFLEKLATRGLRRKSALQEIARKLGCAKSEVEDAERQIASGYPAIEAIDTSAGLDRLEYEALVKEIEDFNEDEDFVTQHRTGDWQRLGRSLNGEARLVVDAVDRLIEVRRLKEITILRGFRRLGGDTAIPPDLTGEADWLPALALRGEGLFFTLDEATLGAWEEQPALWHRAEGLRQRYEAYRHSSVPEVGISPRFLLLHTLAHCLIRQLEAEGGYPAASLRERIYCGGGPSPMAGILVYVAVPDVIGSLGGLVELAEPRRFLRHLVRAFEVAKWCSLDPVCAGHPGQGPGLLNRAACQACALVPEPSCQYGNILLDRTFIKGDPARSVSGLLDNVQSRQ